MADCFGGLYPQTGGELSPLSKTNTNFLWQNGIKMRRIIIRCWSILSTIENYIALKAVFTSNLGGGVRPRHAIAYRPPRGGVTFIFLIFFEKPLSHFLKISHSGHSGQKWTKVNGFLPKPPKFSCTLGAGWPFSAFSGRRHPGGGGGQKPVSLSEEKKQPVRHHLGGGQHLAMVWSTLHRKCTLRFFFAKEFDGLDCRRWV